MALQWLLGVGTNEMSQNLPPTTSKAESIDLVANLNTLRFLVHTSQNSIQRKRKMVQNLYSEGKVRLQNEKILV